MIYKVYSIFDTEVKAYMQPFFLRSKGEAIRALTSLLEDKNSNVAKYPEQFVLFEIGDYDDEKGLIISHTPESLGVAIEFKPEQKLATPSGYMDPTFDDGIERN